MLTVSVIIPAKDEAAHIEAAVRAAFAALAHYALPGEVIAIDDGSQDATYAKLASLRQEFPDLSLRQHSTAWGFGASFLDGVAHAQGQYVVLLPGDHENDADSVLRHVASIQDEDVLIAYVTNPQARTRARQALSSLYTAILNLSFGHRLRYYNGTSIYRTERLRALRIRSRGYFFSAEILLKLLRERPRYREIPIRLNVTGKQGSQALTLRSFRQVATDFLAQRLWG